MFPVCLYQTGRISGVHLDISHVCHPGVWWEEVEHVQGLSVLKLYRVGYNCSKCGRNSSQPLSSVLQARCLPCALAALLPVGVSSSSSSSSYARWSPTAGCSNSMDSSPLWDLTKWTSVRPSTEGCWRRATLQQRERKTAHHKITRDHKGTEGWMAHAVPRPNSCSGTVVVLDLPWPPLAPLPACFCVKKTKL